MLHGKLSKLNVMCENTIRFYSLQYMQNWFHKTKLIKNLK